LASSATNKKDLLAGLAATDTKTVTRVLIDLHMIRPVTNSFQNRENVIDVGIGVVSSEAFALETLPDPDVETDYPQMGWVYANTQVVWQLKDSTDNIALGMNAHFKADIRGQRKVDRGILFMVISNIGVQGSDNVVLYGRVRALCLT